MWKADVCHKRLWRVKIISGASSESRQGTQTRQAGPPGLIYQPGTVTIYRETHFSRVSVRAAGQTACDLIYLFLFTE